MHQRLTNRVKVGVVTFSSMIMLSLSVGAGVTATSAANLSMNAGKSGLAAAVAPLPSITVLQPNGGETAVVDTTFLIKWSSVNVTGNLKVELSRNGGLNSTHRQQGVGVTH